ncbi:hypothetical protein HLB23_18835 [Nocardia uniformis]|uniref:Uncharacterized protein n=1 Tax=Nocardia uniformis TaxID=53432 RepID=A0A849C2D5_9NOCA|nr:hypothetical protein [Nocardia uniformis]NNH71888.1 hypothetical protein [Nocardia uniformis]
MTDTANPTVLDALRSTAAGPFLDRPVTDVLGDLGLPQLPQLPEIPGLPELQLPALPTIDPTALIEPVVELLTGFGSGSLGSGFDPTTLLSSVADVLTSAASQSSSAMSKVSSSWVGDAAVAAQAKSIQVQQDALNVAAQGQHQKLILLDAERVVAQGYAEVTGIIAKLIGQLIAAAPLLPTPAGLPFMIGLATEAAAEAGVVVAKTRGELTVKTMEIAGAGTKIMVAGAPLASNAAALANAVNTAVQPLTSIAPTVAAKVVEKGTSVVSAGSDAVSKISSTGQQLLSGLSPSTTQTPTTTPTGTKTEDKDKNDKSTDTGGDGGGGGGPSGLIGGVPAGGGSPSQLSNWSGARGGLGDGSPASGSPSSRASNQSTQAQTTRTSPGMMPGSGAAGRAGDAGASGDRTTNTNLVTGSHGDEVVGLIEGVSMPVVGALDDLQEPPDKELTL